MQPFEKVVAAHGPLVLRVCRALLGPVDADDAWSETFLSALAAYPGIAADSNVKGWLVTIAHRKAIDVLRRKARNATPNGDLPEPHVSDPERFDDSLRSALDALTPRQRAAVVLHHVAGLSYAEVGAHLDSNEAAARRNAADGIARLRILLPKGLNR